VEPPRLKDLPKITPAAELHASHLWDASTIATLDAITEKYRRRHARTWKSSASTTPAS
jgi:hypothetical protein